MFASALSKVTVVILAVLAATAEAHSKMSLPKPTWDNGYGTNSPSGTIDGPSALTAPSGMSFSTDPTSNTKAFTAALKSSKYGSLKALAFATQKTEAGATKECGFSKSNSAAQPLPDTVQWDELTPSHEGPCEVWCDNNLAFHGDNCAKSYTGTPAKLPYDKSKCSGAKVLMSIWLALHTPMWQVYTNCAPIGSGGGSSSSTTTGGNSGATVPAPAPAQGSGGASNGASTDEYNNNSGGNIGGNSNTGGATGGNNNKKNTGNAGKTSNNNTNNNKGMNTGNNNNNNNKSSGNAPAKPAGNTKNAGNSWTFGSK